MTDASPSQSARFGTDLQRLIRAAFPGLAIASSEEERVLATLRDTAARLNRTLYLWTCTEGLRRDGARQQERLAGTEELLGALERARAIVEGGGGTGGPAARSLFVFLDVHAHWGERASRDWARTRQAIRRTRELLARFEQSGHTFIAVSPCPSIPDDLLKDFVLLDYPLPDEIDLLGVMADLERDGLAIALAEEQRLDIARACLGMTLKEARNVLAKAGAIAAEEGRPLGPELKQFVVAEKKQVIRKSGLLEFLDPGELDAVGGLEELKAWLGAKAEVFRRREEARTERLSIAKGVLLVGVPGCGKSMVAKTIAREFTQPLLRFDIGRVFGQWVGTSEQNMRTALAIAEAVAPSVLWIDEVEKAFAGVGGGGDSGVATRIFGSFLSWMQDRQKDVFVVATANSVADLPPEFKRKGRFDEIFWLDRPHLEERMDILRKQVGQRLRGREFDWRKLAEASDLFTGAELEQAVVEAHQAAFLDRRKLTDEDIIEAMANLEPFAKSDEYARLQASRPSFRPASRV